MVSGIPFDFLEDVTDTKSSFVNLRALKILKGGRVVKALKLLRFLKLSRLLKGSRLFVARARISL